MNEWQIGSLVVGLAAGLTFGGGAVALWAQQQRRVLRGLAQRSEQARQHLLQQNAQARKQVEQVQARLQAARHQLAVHAAQAGQVRPGLYEGAADSRESQGPVIGYSATDGERSVDGFASTQVVWRAH